MAGPGILANDAGDASLGTPTVVRAPQHGQISLDRDGCFTYRPDAGFSGIDAFWYTVRVNGKTSNVAVVQILVTPGPIVTASPGQVVPTPAQTPGATAIVPVLPAPSSSPDAPAASGDDPFSIENANVEQLSIDLGTTDLLRSLLEWLVPSVALTVPGLLIVILVGIQALTGIAWLPAVRRFLGGFGIRRRDDDLAPAPC